MAPRGDGLYRGSDTGARTDPEDPGALLKPLVGKSEICIDVQKSQLICLLRNRGAPEISGARILREGTNELRDVARL